MQAGTGAGGFGASIGTIAFASAIGTTIEWYDFFLFGVVTPIVLNKLFFPNFDPLVGTLLAYTTFFVGFVSRPIGGIIFGHYGDRIGRKTVLILTLLIMGIATFLIGLLPTYDSVGIWAPVLLLILRVFQGIGIGGEWGGAVLMAVEHSPTGKRGFYGSWPQIGVPAGLLLSSGMVYLLSYLPEKDFFSWGWRVAFLISAILVAVGLYIRLKIMETPAFTRIQASDKVANVPFVELFRTHGKNTLLGLGARYIEGVTFNIFGVFIVGRTAFSSFREARETLRSQEKVVEQGEEALRLARARSEAGTATQLDVLGAQTALTQARTTQVQAQRDYAVAKARLQRAIGELNISPAT